MVQEALKRHVLRLLRVWRERFIFNDDYINGLQVRFCLFVVVQAILQLLGHGAVYLLQVLAPLQACLVGLTQTVDD